MIITCIGDSGVDHYTDHNLLLPGGIILNFAVHARKMFPSSDSIEVVSPLGDDKEAETVMEVIHKYGIVPHIARRNGKTPVQYIEHDARGEKQFTKYETGVLADFKIGEDAKSLIQKSDFVMTVIYTQIETFFKSVIACKPKGLMAVDFMDLSDYDKRADIVRQYINNLDIAFFGLRSHDKELLASLKQLAADYKKLFIITLGSDGSMAYDGDEELSSKAIPVEKVVDTTGAGDAFAAAFCFTYLTTHDVQQSLNVGNKHAAEVVQQVGSF